ncbi:MAG: dephospho-CoA kinase [Woeseiaceae bacterium]|nr:dephospho-CoA kinase [Woeseiaceae bacterium]
MGVRYRQLVPGFHGLTNLVRASGNTINYADKKRLFVGLTGGIASGKSLAADYFAALGTAIVDTDVIAREVVAPDAPALDEIQRVFGDCAIAPDGSLDRREMRRIVFADDEKRRQLESILHPRIREAASIQTAEADGPYVMIVVPLMFESPMKESMDRILVVDCSVETQLERLTARDRESVEQARLIIASQASREERLSIADDVISNDGDRNTTKHAVQELHEFYLQLAIAR